MAPPALEWPRDARSALAISRCRSLVKFDRITVTGTEDILMAAVLADGETVIPERLGLGVAITEFERDPAKDQREQHQHDRKVDRWNDDREGDGKSGEQAQTAENQPRLVAIPDRRDRVHNLIARVSVGRKIVKHTDTEIETIKRDIEKDADGQDRRPDRNEAE